MTDIPAYWGVAATLLWKLTRNSSVFFDEGGGVGSIFDLEECRKDSRQYIIYYHGAYCIQNDMECVEFDVDDELGKLGNDIIQRRIFAECLPPLERVQSIRFVDSERGILAAPHGANCALHPVRLLFKAVDVRRAWPANPLSSKQLTDRERTAQEYLATWNIKTRARNPYHGAWTATIRHVAMTHGCSGDAAKKSVGGFVTDQINRLCRDIPARRH